MTTEEQVYTAEVILDTPFPGMDDQTVTESKSSASGDVQTSPTIPNKPFPTKHVAIEVMSSVLNTHTQSILGEFQFQNQGAIQIGTYQPGVSGDMHLSPLGIAARDSAGNPTFAIDAATGDAFFRGTLQAGTLISGEVVVGNNRVIIDGENGRIIVSDEDGVDRILIGYLLDGF